MKKVLKSFFAIMCAVIMFLVPTASASAATIVDYYHSGNYTRINYSTDSPLIAMPGETIALANLENNGRWHLNAGQKLTFGFTKMQRAAFEYTVLEVTPTYKTIANGTFPAWDEPGISQGIDRVSETGDYVILLKPTSTAALMIDMFNIYIE
jgi:hypothetical protein